MTEENTNGKLLRSENKGTLKIICQLLAIYERLKKGPPPLEFISIDEVYIKNPDGTRGKRICGRHLKGYPAVFVCQDIAGIRTAHPGVGPCYRHEFKGTEQAVQKRLNHLWTMLNEEHGLPSNLVQMLEYARYMDRKILENVDPDIRILYAILAILLKNDDAYSMKQAIGVLEKIGKLKYLRKKIESETKLDTETVGLFVRQVIDVVRKYSSETATQHIMAEIFDSIIRPYKEKDKIVESIDAEIEDVDTKNVLKTLIPKGKKSNDDI